MQRCWVVTVLALFLILPGPGVSGADSWTGNINYYILDAEIDYNGRSDDDSGVGYWVDIGWYWNFYERLNFAWEFRYSSTEVTLLNKKGDVGGWRWGLLLGYHF